MSSGSPRCRARYSFLIIAVLLATSLSSCRLVSAEDTTFEFTVSASSDNSCNTSLTCLGGAHVYGGDGNGLYAGRLTLITSTEARKPQTAGLLYYSQPARMKDPSTQLAASFNTSFTTDIVMETWDPNNTATAMRGDGMTFVMSADNTTRGSPARNLGIFDSDGIRTLKTVVVEFDSWQNLADPFFDINDNHVSLEFMNATPVASANASTLGIDVWCPRTLFIWIEYSAETEQLEVRISRNNARPVNPFLDYKVNLSDFVEEFMWVGFSSGNGDHYSSYYITDWTFQSFGIPLSHAQDITKKSSSNVGLIVAIAVAVPAGLAVVGLSVLLVVRRRRREDALTLGSPSKNRDLMLELQLSGMPESFTYKQLSVATRAFSEESKLGQGGFGSVYRGVLPTSGTPVAVKKISGDSKQGAREFLSEVSIISQLRHRNLIQLLGWCKDRGKYLLVYELMPNGSLDKALFLQPHLKHSALSWSQRLNIVTGTAAALDYLHQGWKQQVIHRDVKASNIMLDDEWNAKLGDFGLARLVDHQGPAATTLVAGTYGYIAPEAVALGKFTDKTDVFAFGAVALEIACGRKAVSLGASTDEIVLVDWVWQRLSDGDLLSVVDKRLGDYDTYSMEMVLLLGLLCSHPDPSSRPTIRHVVEVLQGDVPVPSVPISKPAPVFRDSQRVSIQDLYGSSTKTTTSSTSQNPKTASFGSFTESKASSFVSESTS